MIERHSNRGPDRPDIYQIVLQGHSSSFWSDWFDGFAITLDEHGQTILAGLVTDQAALHGLLKKIRDLGMPLISVQRLILVVGMPEIDPLPDNADVKHIGPILWQERDVFSALADPTRRKITEMLASHGPLSATAISDRFDVSPPAISQHPSSTRGGAGADGKTEAAAYLPDQSRGHV